MDTSRCEHCESGAEDSAEHTLQSCGAWRQEREALMSRIGNDLTLKSVVKAMCEDEETWREMSSFAEDVMGEKEEVERERQKREHGIVSSSWSSSEEGSFIV